MKEYIEREAVRDLIEAAWMDDWNLSYSNDRLDEIPAADVVEVKHGHWIEDACGAIWCSQCSHAEESCEQKMYRYRYCPNCGAKMDGGGE